MPDDRGGAPQGYLADVLAAGAKPFRYRSGIRTLLGRRGDPGARIAHPLQLPPAGFHYLRNVPALQEGIETARVVQDRELPEPPPGVLPTFHSPTAPAMVPSAAAGARQEPSSGPRSPVRSVAGESSAGLSPQPRPSVSDRTPTRELRHETFARELSIDVPGVSPRPASFPAPTPRANPTASARVPGTGEPREEPKVQSAPRPGETRGAVPSRSPEPSGLGPPIDLHSPLKFARSPGSGAPAASRKREDAVSGRIRKGIERKGVGQDPDPGSTAISERARPITSMTLGPRQAAVEAEIEQLRRGTDVLTRTPATPETNAPLSDSGLSLETDRYGYDAPPPVVLVEGAHVYAQTRTPAFWERSYLSHLLRSRRLR